MEKVKFTMIVLGCIVVLMGGCATAPKTAESKAVMSAQVAEAISTFKAKDPSIERFFDKSYGYAVLPKVIKGGFWVGGAGGQGEVFEQKQMVGHCRMTQASLGFTFGGQYFREIIFFRDKEDLDRFRSEDFTFSGQVTGVALRTGVAATTDYKSGMAVFLLPDAGLMVDASLGGQKFKYVAKQVTE